MFHRDAFVVLDFNPYKDIRKIPPIKCSVCFALATHSVLSKDLDEGTHVIFGDACQEHLDWLIQTYWKEGRIIKKTAEYE